MYTLQCYVQILETQIAYKENLYIFCEHYIFAKYLIHLN